MFNGEKWLRTNEAWLRELAAFTIAGIQRNGESIVMRAARDLAENQILAWKIGNHQSGSALSAGSIGSRKRYDKDFAGYRFEPRGILFWGVPISRENRVAQLGAVERLIARVLFQAHREVVNSSLQIFRQRGDLLVNQFARTHECITSRILLLSPPQSRIGIPKAFSKIVFPALW